MFEFYIAAREQKETGHPGIFSRQKHSTIIYVICLLLICLWFAGMVLVGGYARQLWVLWIVKAEVTVEAETPAFKQSTQHYFFKKQPLPVVESVEEEDDPGVAVENAPSSSEDEENTVEESEEKAGLRERVKNALNEFER
ncbi:putative general secretion pathway protein GspB [Escherichia coli]|uniref:putative general secretion pathway protein GspB n=1 Tax=Escherichia coli TaxID=562 RepID=UPI0019944C10|nr:putative general secretion pathway protein GspB [Escherichia coli]